MIIVYLRDSIHRLSSTLYVPRNCYPILTLNWPVISHKILCFRRTSCTLFSHLCRIMEISSQQLWSTMLRFTGLVFGSSGPTQAPFSESMFTWAIKNCGESTTTRPTNPAAAAADSDGWTSTLNEMAHDGKPACVSKDQIHDMFIRTNSFVITTHREELRSLVQVELESVVEAAWPKEMRRTPKSWSIITSAKSLLQDTVRSRKT